MPHSVFPVAALQPEDILKPSPFADKYAITHPMSRNNTSLLLRGVIDGPEHVLAGPGAQDGELVSWSLWTSSKNGTIYSTQWNGKNMVDGSLREEIYAGPGRVLGFAWDGQGGAYFCNSVQVAYMILLAWPSRAHCACFGL